MFEIIINIVISLCVFIGIVILFAENSNNKFQKTNYILTGASVAGLLIYGYGFSTTLNNPLQVIIRTVLASLGMFLGKNEYSAIKEAPYMDSEWVCFVFWTVHVIALYVTANAVLASIGTKALKRYELMRCSGFRKIVVIYGLNEDSLTLAKELADDEEKKAIIFFDEKPDASYQKKAVNDRYLVLSEEKELSGFINNVGSKRNRKVSVNFYCMKRDGDENILFAEKIKSQLSGLKNTELDSTLTLLANMETTEGEQFQENNITDGEETEKGFGSVQILDRPYLIARSLVHCYPPCDIVEFDENGQAKGDFHAVIIGFGKIGQAVLKNLFLNGQFSDRPFKAEIFDPDYENVSGYIKKRCPALMNNYLCPEINPHLFSAGNEKFYEVLDSIKGDNLYIVVCTGDKETDRETAKDIMAVTGREVYECSYDGIICNSKGKIHKNRIYCRDLLDVEKADQTAMMFNQVYTDASKLDDIKEQIKNWGKCDYFSRMSNRAAADYISVYRRMTGGNIHPSDELKLVLAKQEHLRWSSFHFAFGYQTMSDEEFESRAEQWKTDHSVRIQKNTADRHHACLIPWDDLNALSEKHGRAEGKEKDYQKDDYNNIDIILKIMEKEQAEKK